MSEHRNVYILEQKRIEILSLPSWLEIQDEQLFFSGDMTNIPDDCTSFMELGEILDRKLKEYLIKEGYDGVFETWTVVEVFEDEATAQIFAKSTDYRYPDGYRVHKFYLHPTEDLLTASKSLAKSVGKKILAEDCKTLRSHSQNANKPFP